MARKVKAVYRNRSQTGQGSHLAEIHGGRTTYGYDMLLPLVVNSVAIPQFHIAQERPVAGPSRSQEPPLPTDEEVPLQPMVVEQNPIVVTPAPMDQLTDQQPDSPPATSTATLPVRRRPVPTTTRTPRRIGQCASLLQELRGIQEQQDGLFLATDSTRRDEIEVRRAKSSVDAAKVELKRSRLMFQEKKWIKEVEMQEKKWQKDVEMAERKMNLEELKQLQKFELEQRKLELDEKKFKLECRQREIE